MVFWDFQELSGTAKWRLMLQLPLVLLMGTFEPLLSGGADALHPEFFTCA
jgi:hypothetical protein